MIGSRPTIDQGEIRKCAAEQTFGYVPADPAGPPFERLVPGGLEMRRRTTGLQRHRVNGHVRYIEAVGMGLMALARQ